MNADDIRRRIHFLSEHIDALDKERTLLAHELSQLQQKLAKAEEKQQAMPASNFSPEQKIQIFLNLFRGGRIYSPSAGIIAKPESPDMRWRAIMNG